MTKAVLLDLGNVVLGIDFRRVFTYWAKAAGVEETVFYDGWAMDQAYKDHEVGLLHFEDYVETLRERFGVDMPMHAWRNGWNDLWTEPFAGVIELLPPLADRYHLCGFTNTNDTHASRWRDLYGDQLNSFASIYVSSEIGMRKPDEASYKFVCEDMATPPDRTLFIDDSVENVRGAEAAGLQAVHATNEAQVVASLRRLLD